MLWLALYLPQLPLESAATGTDEDRAARVIYQNRNGQHSVYRLNAAAAQAGIEPGMPLPAARSLCAELQASERIPAHEQATLRGLGLWAMQFTSKVSLEPPHGMILEVGASLGLFGGLEKIRHNVLAGLSTQGYSAYSGVAPVAAAAWLLALNQDGQVVTHRTQLTAMLRPLPLLLLPIDDEKKTALFRLGLQSIGDCLRLPRDGLGQRLGKQLLVHLDRIQGLAPDPRAMLKPPDYFQSQLMLPEPVNRVQSLLFLLQRLLRQLHGFLRARDAGTQRMRLGLIMPCKPMQWLQLTLLQPGRDPQHLFKLWQEKLERQPLPAPVEGLELEVRQLLPLQPTAAELFSNAQKSTTAFVHTLERLKNRLGERLIRQPQCSAEHRPELATRQADFPSQEQGDSPNLQRPLWLLPRPRPLVQASDGHPCLQGPLTLLSGPERIESGWWDGRDRRRDYYVARNRRQQRLWIYRECNPPRRWFLHGFFA